jgi:hypothetical protein
MTSDGTNWASELPTAAGVTPGTSGNVLTSDGTNWASVAAGGTFSTNASNKIQHLYLTGSGTWTKPSGVTHIHVECVGGGQAGGPDGPPYDEGGNSSAGGNGGPGDYSENILDVSNITSLDWVAGIASAGAGGFLWGGTTYFGSNGTLQTTSLTVTVVAGAITAIAFSGGGGSITIPPIIVIEPNATSVTGRGGAGAIATAQISGGLVTGITVTNGGTGYVSGQVQAWFGIGAGGGLSNIATSAFGMHGNHGANKNASTYIGGLGLGGAGQNAGGGGGSAGTAGGIYIKEYR